MAVNPLFEEQKNNQRSAELLDKFESAHKEELEAITQVLVKITSRSPSEIKPHLDTMLERLIESDTSRTPQERSRAFRQWVESHRGLNVSPLTDEAISRESIYGERG